jgi:2-oxoglutarate dehydrogenase E2 component (dihydrolipoamide succinyltransferase)
MTIQVKVPVLPESVADATIATWHKKVGDSVKQEENLVDIETDKVMLEVPAPQSGIIKEIKVAAGTTVLGEQVIAIIEKASGDAKAVPAKVVSASQASVSFASSSKSAGTLTPASKRAAMEAGIDLGSVSGSGKGGRITKEDVARHQELMPEASEMMEISIGDRIEKRVPMSRLRQRVAQRLVEAQHTAAMLTTFNEINMHAVMNLRQTYKDQFEKAHGVRLGFMSFFIKASVEALKRFPSVNSSIDGTDIIYHGYYDIGVAVSTERGLVVPVVRNADQMNMGELEKQVSVYATRARDNKLTVEEMTGGTFTMTNGGVFGSLMSTPILNPPQVAILGMHKIEQRPIVENNQVVIRPMMYVALSYDHRIIDGKESVQFLQTIKEFIEDPARLVLSV